MKRATKASTIAAVTIVLIIAATAGASHAATPAPKAHDTHAATPARIDPVSVATALLDNLEAGRFDAAAAPFSARMREAVPTERLKQIWLSLPAATGRGTATARAVEGATLVTVPLHRAGVDLVAQVAVQADGQIAGFMVQPAPPPAAAAPAADARFVERDFAVGSGVHALPGTLAMPRGAGPFPAVVLVHGSGPQDRDETIGANRPFLDIARDLASHGIAVLRYEKRTQAHPEDFAGRDFTMDDETTNDAVLAVEALRGAPGIDPKRVFVFGHSQGAMLAPRIASRSGHVAGLVMLAAPARRLLDLLPEQNRYMAALDGKTSPEEAAFIAKLDSTIAAVRSGKPMQAADTPLGLPVAYWRAIDAVDPVADAKAIRQPMLLLQGDRDFQVTAPDWALWQSAFGKDRRVTIHHYAALSHLGIAGTGPGSLAEYSTPGHVDAQLLADVVAWIHAR